MNKKDAGRQVVSAYDIAFESGKEKGKQGVLVNVGALEVLFNKTNALDIAWVKYKGNNISFLSKNGLNSNIGEFPNKFEGGFLYTCGMDNVSSCVGGKPVHGSLHYSPAENVYVTLSDDSAEVFGTVRQTALFAENIALQRHFTVRVLPRRGRQYFDGMNTHNTCIKYWNGKYYLYYMGTTYGGDIPGDYRLIDEHYALETWNRKRIGVAVADDIEGEFVRRDEPLLEPRDCSHWDCTITTNPSVVILPDGKTYMIYKSRRAFGKPLQLGIAVADKPDGKFERLTENPILEFADENKHIEDPFLWYDKSRKKFCMIAKDDSKNGDSGITGEWGAGFYAESDDCIHFEISENPKVYSRNLEWEDGRKTTQCNLERPSILFDENGEPIYLFCASGDGYGPYAFKGVTYVVGIKLERKQV